jgi:hypothetical protein
MVRITGIFGNSVILNVGELALAMSQVEVIGVRKSFPLRNLSAEATTFSLRGLGLYRTAVRIAAPRLESLPFVRCGKGHGRRSGQ